MRFFIGLLIGIGAALGAAAIWDHYAANDAAEHTVDTGNHIAQSDTDRPEPSLPPAPDPTPPVAAPTPSTAPPPRQSAAEMIPAVLSVPIASEEASSTVMSTPAPVERQPNPDATAQTAPAWTPFHSRASARGFARHLSEKTGVEFTIFKEGPGRYEVMFEYATDAERRAIESRIASVAGSRVNEESTEIDYESNS